MRQNHRANYVSDFALAFVGGTCWEEGCILSEEVRGISLKNYFSYAKCEQRLSIGRAIDNNQLVERPGIRQKSGEFDSLAPFRTAFGGDGGGASICSVALLSYG